MNFYRYQYLFGLLDKFLQNLKPSTRILLWSAQVLIVVSLLLFQLKDLIG